MKQLWSMLVLTTLVYATTSARANQRNANPADGGTKGTMVVLPATVLRSAPENAGVVTSALEKVLDQQGFRIVSGERVSRIIREMELDQPRIHPVLKIQELRKALDVDYVVYPRILTVGQGLEANESQINILVNVAGRTKPGAYMHTRQVGQVFKPAVLTEKPVVDSASAEMAVTKLFDGFNEKAK